MSFFIPDRPTCAERKLAAGGQNRGIDQDAGWGWAAGEGGYFAGGVDLADAVVGAVGDVDGAVGGEGKFLGGVEGGLEGGAVVAGEAGGAVAGDGLDNAVGEEADAVVAAV